MVTVEILLYEFSAAVNAAMMRMVASESIGCNHASTYKRTYLERLGEEVVGAVGEVAFAKYRNQFFMPSVNTFHVQPDVGPAEVRATDLEGGCLIVRDNDDDDRAFVLAIVYGEKVELKGWMYGRDAKKPKYLRDPHGRRKSWFVPQQDLKEIKAKS